MHRHRDRSQVYPALPNLGAVMQRLNYQLPTLIFSSHYPIHLLYSLYNFIEKLSKWCDQGEKATLIFSRSLRLFFNESLLKYIASISLGFNNNGKCQPVNWFIKVEILFLLNIIKSMRWNQNIIEPSMILQIGFHLLSCLSQELIMEIVFVFDEVAFNKKFFTKTIVTDHITMLVGDEGEEKLEEQLQQWKTFYCNAVLSTLKLNQVFHRRNFVSFQFLLLSFC